MRRVRLGQARFSVTVEILEASWPPREAGERFERPASAPRLLFIHLTDAAQRWNSKCARVHKVPEKCVESARNASTRGRSGDDRRPSIPPSPFLPRTCAHRTILFKRDEKNRCRVAARLNSRRVETRATPAIAVTIVTIVSFLEQPLDTFRSKSIFVFRFFCSTDPKTNSIVRIVPESERDRFEIV